MMCWWILLVWIGCYYFNSVEYLPNRLLVGQGLGHDVCLCSLCYHLCFTWACCYPQSRSSVLQCLPRALCFSRRVLFLIWIFQLFVKARFQFPVLFPVRFCIWVLTVLSKRNTSPANRSVSCYFLFVYDLILYVGKTLVSVQKYKMVKWLVLCNPRLLKPQNPK